MKKFHMYCDTLCKIAAPTYRYFGNESIHRFKIIYLIFSMYIWRKLTFWNSTDGKKGKNENELLQYVTYIYQKSKCTWNFA